MKRQTPLTALELCTMIAHETVSLLHSAGPDGLNSAAQLREGLGLLISANDLTKEGGDLLAWIDQEADAAGRDAPDLTGSDSLRPVPDAFALLDAVWAFFRATVEQPLREKRQALLDAAWMLADLGGLEDMLLSTSIPAAGFLTAQDLRTELTNVRKALRAKPDQAEMEQRM